MAAISNCATGVFKIDWCLKRDKVQLDKENHRDFSSYPSSEPLWDCFASPVVLVGLVLSWAF